MSSEAPTLQWPLPKMTISPSAINTFVQCAEKFRRQQIKGEWDPSGWSAVLGSAVHGAQEINLGQKVVTGRDMSLSEVEDAYLASYDKQIDEAGGVSEINWRNKDGSVVLPSKAKDIARPVNRLYHEQVAPTVEPIATEHWMRLRIEGVPPVIVGKIDVLKQGSGKIDLKFGGNAPVEPRSDWLLQAAIYNLSDEGAFEWHTGRWGEKSEPAVNTPANAPKLLMKSSPQDRAITERMVRSYVTAMVAYYRAFGPDEPWPGTGKSHTFACAYCPFHPDRGGDCVYWPKAVKAPVVGEQFTLLT